MVVYKSWWNFLPHVWNKLPIVKIYKLTTIVKRSLEDLPLTYIPPDPYSCHIASNDNRGGIA